jgi:peptidyl-prolyl cis-trans isomerase B (cyclophilin B)
MSNGREKPIITMELENGGIIKLELYPEVAPTTVNNFISLARKGFYDGLKFHRVNPRFYDTGRRS